MRRRLRNPTRPVERPPAPQSARTGPRTAGENEMLNFAAELRDSSRLACQISLTDALDGLVVAMPESQH